MAVVDQCAAQFPDQRRDAFKEDKRPLYSTQAAILPIHALIGSAARSLSADEFVEKVRMVPHVDDAESTDTTSTMTLKEASGAVSLTRRICDRLGR